MMWIALQDLLGHLCLLSNFRIKKSKILKKKTPGYIIILYLDPKNHNHLIYSSLKNDTDNIAGYSWPIFALLFHFWPKINIFKKWKKCLKRTKNTKNRKHTKNHNRITCCSSDRVQTRFLSIWGHFCSFTPIFGRKNQNFRKMKKYPRDIIILHTVRSLINVWAKIIVGVRDLS